MSPKAHTTTPTRTPAPTHPEPPARPQTVTPPNPPRPHAGPASAADVVRTPFGAASTARDVLEGVGLAGRRALVTGGSGGIGTEIARALTGAGAHVTLAVRDPAAGARTAEDIARTTGGPAVRVRALDLADRDAIAAFTAAWDEPLDILVNTAGVMALPSREVNARGVERQFAVNHLGHFALATGLRPALAAAPAARVVSVTCAAHRQAPVDLDDISFVRRPYDPWIAYAQSKTANVLFAVEANRRWAADGITVNAVHPGGVRTRLMRHQDRAYLDRVLRQYGSADRVPWKTPEQAAATPVLAAASPLLDGVGGRYFEDCAEARPDVLAPADGALLDGGVTPWALDRAAALRLWEVSLTLIAPYSALN